MMEADFYFHYLKGYCGNPQQVKTHKATGHRQPIHTKCSFYTYLRLQKHHGRKSRKILKPRDPGCLLQDSDFYIWHRSYFYRTLKDVVACAAQEWWWHQVTCQTQLEELSQGLSPRCRTPGNKKLMKDIELKVEKGESPCYVWVSSILHT